MGAEFKTERLVVLVEPSLREQVEEAAKEDAYRVNGQPSSAAVVRAALDLFFALRGRQINQSDEAFDSTLEPATAAA